MESKCPYSNKLKFSGDTNLSTQNSEDLIVNTTMDTEKGIEMSSSTLNPNSNLNEKVSKCPYSNPDKKKEEISASHPKFGLFYSLSDTSRQRSRQVKSSREGLR